MALLVVDEVRRQVAAVELHAFDDVQLVLEAGTSSTVITPSLPTLSMASAMMLPIRCRSWPRWCRPGRWPCRRTRHGQLRQLFGDGSLHGLVDAALEVHRVHAGGDRLQALAQHGLGQHGGGGGAVTGDVGGLGSDFLDHLRAHVLELVFELDFLGDGHAVLGDGRGAEALVEHDVAALRAERDADRRSARMFTPLSIL
jgi:hypothetical protein